MLPRLYVILDVDIAAARGWSPYDLARRYLDGGATLLQVRAKQLASGPLLELCDRLVERAHGSGARVIVNDRADTAAMSGADGVHVGQTDLTPVDVRRVIGEDAIVGLSTHDMAQVDAARGQPITYVAIGPVFGTPTKDTGYEAVGLDLLAYAARTHACPVVAIGGVTLEHAPRAIEAGAQSVAVISDLLVDGPPEQRVRAYLAALEL